MSCTWDLHDMANSRDGYKKLIVMLCNDFRYAKILGDLVTPEDVDRVALALVHVTSVMGRGLPLVKVMTQREFERNNSTATIFRLMSLASRVIGQFAKQGGIVYLEMVLKEILGKLLENELKDSLEVDPNKFPRDMSESDKDMLIQQHSVKLMNVAQMIFDRITSPSIIQAMPRGMRATCHLIRSECRARPDRFNEEDIRKLVGGFIMLRFFNPAIVTPEAFDLLPPGQAPSMTARRNLVLVTKVLQNLSNNVQFGLKEGYMICMNPFLVRNAMAMQNFLLSLPEDPLARPNRAAWDDLDFASVAPLKEPAHLRNYSLGHLMTLQTLMVKHENRFREQLPAVDALVLGHPGTSFEYVMKTLGHNSRYANIPKKGGGASEALGRMLSVSLDVRVGTVRRDRDPRAGTLAMHQVWRDAEIFYASSSLSKEGNPVIYFIVRKFFYEWLLDPQLLIFLQEEFTSVISKIRKRAGSSESMGEGDGPRYELVIDLSWTNIPSELMYKLMTDFQLFAHQLPKLFRKSLHRVYIVNPNRLYFLGMYVLTPVISPVALHTKIQEIFYWKMLRSYVNDPALPTETKYFYPNCYSVTKVAKKLPGREQRVKPRLLKVAGYSILDIDFKANLIKKERPIEAIDLIRTTPEQITIVFDKTLNNKEVRYNLRTSQEVQLLAQELLHARLEISATSDRRYTFDVEKVNNRNRRQKRMAKVCQDCIMNVHNNHIRGLIPFLGIAQVTRDANVVKLHFKGVHDQMDRGEREMILDTEQEASMLSDRCDQGLIQERRLIQDDIAALASMINSTSLRGMMAAFRCARKWLRITRERKIAVEGGIKTTGTNDPQPDSTSSTEYAETGQGRDRGFSYMRSAKGERDRVLNFQTVAGDEDSSDEEL